MTAANPVLLSIAVLSAFALFAGGVWLTLKSHDMKRGILMIIAGIVILGNVIIWVLPMPAA